MIVEQVDFVAIPTRDMERAIAFYRDVIGLPQSAHAENEFEAGNVTLAIWAPEAHGYDFKDNGQGDVALRVPDVAAARAELEAEGHRVRRRHARHRCLPHGVLRRSGRQLAHAAPALRPRTEGHGPD